MQEARICLFAFSFVASAFCQVLVTLPNGQIQGQTLDSITGSKYLSFLGIPYAKPPLDELRFMPPQKPENWTGVKNTTALSNACYNIDSDFDTEDEDCLYINVYTPILNASANATKLPVVFASYGGAFRNGKAGYNPRYWMVNDVVVVSYNYRVGPFGFLSTGDTVLPGNAGLKDQLFALQWVNENIHLFGGNKSEVTLTGQSAGGASVGYLLLNPQAKGLFRAAISESGSPLNTWTYNPDPLSYTIQLAQTINSSISSNLTSAEYLSYLQSVPAKTIDSVSPELKLKPIAFVEPANDRAVLTRPMFEAFAEGNYTQVPMILGVNSEEQIKNLVANLTSLKTKAAAFDTKPEKALPDSYTLKSGLSKTIVGKVIRDVYAGGADINLSDHLGKYVKWSSDNRFTRGIIKQGLLMSNYSPVYFYQFSYKGPLGNNNLSIAEADNVAHGEENPYFPTRSTTDDGDALTHDRLFSMWSNFVKYLNPTPIIDPVLQNLTWPAVSPSNYTYLNINDSLSIEIQPKGEYFLGWQNLFDTYMQRPFTTY